MPSSRRRVLLWGWRASVVNSAVLAVDVICCRFFRRYARYNSRPFSFAHGKPCPTRRRQDKDGATLLFLFFLLRFQQQVLIVEAEVGQRGDCSHSRAVDRP